MNVIYEDERVICNESEIIIKNFYQPIDDDKKILYSDICNVTIKKLNPFAGLSQIWGNAGSSINKSQAHKHYWFAFDLKRLFKSKAIVIDDGTLVKSAITPEDVERVFQILKEKTSTAQQ